MVVAGIDRSSAAVVVAFALGSLAVACLVLATESCSFSVHLVLGSAVSAADSFGYTLLVFAG